MAGGNTKTFNNSPQQPDIVQEVSTKNVEMSGTLSAIYPGTYYIVCTPKEGNYWEDGSNEPITLQWKIKPKTVKVPEEAGNHTYSGKKITSNWNPTLSSKNHITLKGGSTQATEVGVYTIQVGLIQPEGTPDDTFCYVWEDGSYQDKSLQWEIKGQNASTNEIDRPHWEGGDYIYTGSEQGPTLVGAQDGTVEISGNQKTDVGSYVAIAKPKQNYSWPGNNTDPITCNWRILPQSIKKPELDKTEFEYNKGKPVGPKVESKKKTELILSGVIEAIEVGTYSIGFTPNENCVWEDGTSDTIWLIWKIVPAKIYEITEENTKVIEELADEKIVVPADNYTWADGTTTQKTIPNEYLPNITDTGGPIGPTPSIELKRQEIASQMQETDSDLKRTLHANGVFFLEDMKFNDSFYRYPRNDPYNYVDGAREYLFFTKPDLPLVHDGNASGVDAFLTAPAKNIAYFTDLAESPGYRKSVFSNLSYSGVKKYDGCPFIRILSNRKTSNMDIPDLQVEELETAVNMYGTKILYPKSSSSSDEGVDFNIEFEDDRFCEIYHLFKVWDYYRTLKWYGVVSPASFLKEYGDNKTNRTTFDEVLHAMERDIMEPNHTYDTPEGDYVNYLFYKVLHDHIRVFKFLIDNDGETVLYAASAIGCYPKTIQRSTFSEIPDRGPLKINIGFKVSGWFDDNMTSVIQDFNDIVGSWKTYQECTENEWPIYDDSIGFVSQELVDVPFIVKVDPVSSSEGNPGRNTEFARYLFKWARFDSTSGTNQSYSVGGTASSGSSSGSVSDSQEESSEPLTNVMAPNGKMVTQNDWDYLANQNYDDDAIRTMLFTSDKYKDPNT